MKFAIVSIGTELNLGLILNTNSKYIAEILSDIGLECNYMITVRDNEEDISKALKICLDYSDIIVINGGLGPTDDDLTRLAVAKALDRKLLKDRSLDNTSLRFLKYINNDKVTETLMRQSYIPEGSIPIKPRLGSASGFIVEDNDKLIFAIPGVPREMRDMFDGEVVPYIKVFLKDGKIVKRESKENVERVESKKYGNLKAEKNKSDEKEKKEVVRKAILLTTDISESQIEFSIKDVKTTANKLNVTIGVTATPGLIKIILIAKSCSPRICKKNLTVVEKAIRQVIGDHIYGTGDSGIGDSIRQAILIRKKSKGGNLTISTAESITGGLISSLITDTPGSSEYFLGSVISYSDSSKKSILGVDTSILESKGAVSKEACIGMAQKAKKLFNSEFSIAATGVAGPTSPEKGKDVGLVYCGIVGPGEYQEIYEKKYLGTREDIKFRTAQFILNQLRLAIGKI